VDNSRGSNSANFRVYVPLCAEREYLHMVRVTTTFTISLPPQFDLTIFIAMQQKTWVIWALLIIVVLSIVLELWSLVAIFLLHKQVFPRSDIANAFALAMIPIDIGLSAIFAMKLSRMANLRFWTNVTFGYSVIMQAYMTLADGFEARPWALTTPNIVELCFTIGLWTAFICYLGRLHRRDRLDVR